MKKQEQNLVFGLIWYNICMEFEERERQKRRQFIGVLFAEIGMVFSVIAIVVVATLAAMGFFVSSDGSIEQSGLIQIHSTPTGGTVELDGGVLFSRTNLSRSMPPGEHRIKISRDGYDTWEKTVKMYSGMLIRLYYPRIFLKSRTAETVLSLDDELEFYTPSMDYDYILYALKDSPKWQLANIKNDEIKVMTLDLSEVLPGVKEKQFGGKIEQLTWSKNSDYVLVRVSADAQTEWILVNLRDTKQSLNLTKTFGMNFQQVQMIDHAAGQLFALENHHLRRINTNNQAISRVLLDNVQSFEGEGNNLIYVATQTGENDQKEQQIGVYRDGEAGGTVLAKAQADSTVRVQLAKYYDEEYIIFTVDDKVTIYYGAIPSYRAKVAETEFANFKVLLSEVKLNIVPDRLDVSAEGEYLVAQKGKQFSVVDMDMGDVFEYETPTAAVYWLDESMFSAVVNGELKVWDFDYTNQRTLVSNQLTEEDGAITTVSKKAVADYPAVITSNDKWLYYIVQDKTTTTLRREKIRD